MMRIGVTGCRRASTKAKTPFKNGANVKASFKKKDNKGNVFSFWNRPCTPLRKDSIMLRFTNENSYLNWARNGVLSSAVGVSMYDQEHHRGAQLSGAGLLLLGFSFITAGTAKYIYYIVRFKRQMQLSLLMQLGTCSFAMGALGIWLTATACFLEFVPIGIDYALLTDPIAAYLPRRIRSGLIDTYHLYQDTEEEERVIEAMRRKQE